MRMISNYHRPAQLDEALALLNRGDASSMVIAGGTVLAAAELPEATEVIDLQTAVGAAIDRRGDRVVYEAMARLQDVADHDATPPLLVELARREGPNTLRNASTIGGSVAEANSESELLAGLLVHEAIVTIERPDGPKESSIEDVLGDPKSPVGGIVTQISAAIAGETASARTGRTPADTSIVAATGRVVSDGIRVALTGVATTPILVNPDDLSELDPPADFRGTSEYRKDLAVTLARRVLAQLGGAS